MLFKGSALGDERAFVTVKNTEATSFTIGQAIAINLGNTASFDGTQCVRPASGTAANLPGFLGIAVQNIPANSYGLVQIYGNVLSVQLSVVNTSITVTAGDPLIPGAATGTLFSGVPTYAASGFNWVIVSNAPQATLSQAAPLFCSGFIRCIK